MPNIGLVIAVGALLGLVMGLLGGGGGIIAVPLLVALGLSYRQATTASLVVVGIGALAGLVPHYFARRVDWRIGATFGGLGAAGAIVGARLGVTVSPWFIAVGFPVLLALAFIAMARSARHEYVVAHDASGNAVETPDETAAVSIRSWPLLIVLATGVGLVTGFFGVGGGFIVVPALVVAIKMPVRRATATGLLVIAINSAVALAARHGTEPAWSLTLTIAATTAAFTVVGALISRRVPGWMLSTGFAALVAVVTSYTVLRLIFAGIS